MRLLSIVLPVPASWVMLIGTLDGDEKATLPLISTPKTALLATMLPVGSRPVPVGGGTEGLPVVAPMVLLEAPSATTMPSRLPEMLLPWTTLWVGPVPGVVVPPDSAPVMTTPARALPVMVLPVLPRTPPMVLP